MSFKLFNKLLQQLLGSAGVSGLKISTPSFKRENKFATAMGVSPECLKAHGNWRSDCYSGYVARDNELRAEIS